MAGICLEDCAGDTGQDRAELGLRGVAGTGDIHRHFGMSWISH